MNYDEPKTALSATIANLEMMIENLQKKNRLEKFQRKELDIIVEDLHNIHAGLDFYDNHPLYMLLHAEMSRMFKLKIPVYAYQINIKLKPGQHAPAKIDINLFPEEKQKEERIYEFG